MMLMLIKVNRYSSYIKPSKVTKYTTGNKYNFSELFLKPSHPVKNCLLIPMNILYYRYVNFSLNLDYNILARAPKKVRHLATSYQVKYNFISEFPNLCHSRAHLIIAYT